MNNQLDSRHKLIRRGVYITLALALLTHFVAFALGLWRLPYALIYLIPAFLSAADGILEVVKGYYIQASITLIITVGLFVLALWWF